MKQAETEKPADISGISLAGYYLIGCGATAIGIFVVVLLNLFTPLESIRNSALGFGNALTWSMVAGRFIPRLAILLVVAFGSVVFIMNRILGPIAGCLEAIREGIAPAEKRMEKARRRLLNLPFIFVPLNVGMWILVPGLAALFVCLSGQMDHRTAIIIAARASMVGLIASAIASHELEAYSRRRLIPFFFPDGRLADVGGTAKLSIARRIRIINRVGNIVPMTILVVTLLTLQWEVDSAAISAKVYGRGIVVFAFILFGYAVLANANLNRVVSRSITQPLTEMIRVLRRVRGGDFDSRVRVISNDEIGYTGDVINEMTRGLREHETLRRSLEVAREVQQNLLPMENPAVEGLDIAGISIYCDETGGDYYDFILPKENGHREIRVVLGDVSGHGISAALLMATGRAFLRQRSFIPGTIGQTVTDVNCQLCRDVTASGSFITLLCMDIDREKNGIQWVRDGNDPGLLFDPGTGSFTELKGNGIALGLDEDWIYTEESYAALRPGQVIVQYTDGIWEAHISQGEMFGKTALCDLIREHASQSAEAIAETVIETLKVFQKDAAPEDDITLIVVKIAEIP